jgi:cell division septum initiation protein DivIVA
MSAADGLLPLETGFDVRWRGYDRSQVREHVRCAEAEVRILAADRDAAEALAANLAREVERLRSENSGLRADLARLGRTPIDPETVPERLRRRVELAHAEAEEIVARALVSADLAWSTADKEAARLRERYQRLVTELDRQRADAAAEHREAMRLAHEGIAEAARRAEEGRHELDRLALAARRREQRDFELANDLRRREAAAAVEERRLAAETEAERVVREAREEAERVTRAARAEVEHLATLERRISEQLRDAFALVDHADALLVQDDDRVQEPAAGALRLSDTPPVVLSVAENAA